MTNKDEIVGRNRFIPDERMYRFVCKVGLAGVFAIPDLWRVFSYISKGERVRLVREKDNSYDENAIRVDMPFYYGSKIGYIPRPLASLWAPIIDSGTFYTGRINDYSASAKSITIDVYERLHLPVENVSSICFGEGGFFSTEFHVNISFKKRQMICLEETEPHSRKFIKTTLTFSKEQWQGIVLKNLQKCNICAWLGDYRDWTILDGTQWGMLIRCGRKHRIRISGSNDYPEEWDLWHDFIDFCLKCDDIQKAVEVEKNLIIKL